MTYLQMYGSVLSSKKDIIEFKAFSCQAYMYLNVERRGNGKHMTAAVETIILGILGSQRTTTSVDNFILSPLKIMTSSQVLFDKLKIPFQKQSVIDQNKKKSQTTILSQVPSGATWVPYDK